MFFNDREYTCSNKNFGQSWKREFQMEVRQAYRNRDLALKKVLAGEISKGRKDSIAELRRGSHFVLEINNIIFLDLAPIESLTCGHPDIVSSLTGNFASMTNEILKRSPFYANHRFETTNQQETSRFTTFLRTTITKDSQVLLLCCVT